MQIHGNIGKKNAKKPEEEKSKTNIYARCKQIDKDLWQEEANQTEVNLSEWIIKNLNRSCAMSIDKKIIQTIKSTNNTEELKSVVTNFLSSIGRNDLTKQSYDEAAYELNPSPEADILLEAVTQWGVLIKDEDHQ